MKSFLKKLALAAGSFVIPFFAFSQSDNSDLFLNGYVSSQWTVSDGLPSNSVTSCIQDSIGYIYFGTYEAMVRYDGVEFRTINRTYEDKYDFVSSRTLFKDSRNNVWNGSNDEGVFCIKTDGSVQRYSTADGIPNNSIRDICEDKEGNIWIGTACGVVYITTSGEIKIPVGFDRIACTNSMLVWDLYCDTAGRIWISTNTENKLFVFQDGRIDLFNGIKSVKNPEVSVVTQDASGALWFGIRPSYAVKIEGSQETLYDISEKGRKPNVINAILCDSNSNMWFATDNGVTVLHGGKMSYFDTSNCLADDNITSIIEDNEKNIWLGTYRGGIQKLSQSKFQVYSVPSTVNAIADDTVHGCQWLAADDGLYAFKDDVLTTSPLNGFFDNVRLRDVTSLDDGTLLVCAYDTHGFCIVRPDGKITSVKKEDGLAGDKVRVAVKSSDGKIWVGTTTGISVLTINGTTVKSISNITRTDGLSNDYIMCLHEDAEGRMWVGTDGGGIFIIDDMKIARNLSTSDGMVGNVIFKIDELSEGEFWISTGTGLSCYKDDSFVNFNSKNKLPSDGIFQILTDYTQTAWLTTNRGIASVKMKDLESVARGESKIVNARLHGKTDGLKNSVVTSTSKSMKDSIGRIWFTLSDGVAVFDPLKVLGTTEPPVITIEEITIDNETFPYDGNTVVLSPSSKRLSIKYNGLSFVSSEQVKFKFMLEGFDEELSDWTTQRSVSYTNLAPGTYQFTVLAQNRDEVLNSLDNKIVIVKKPYLWQRPAFWIATGLLLIALILLFVLVKFRQLKREKDLVKKFSDEIIKAFVGAIDAKDKYTNGHSIRVADYSVMLAKRLGKSKEEQEKIRFAAILHDIGKIGIPDAIINNPNKLTPEEYDVIKKHPSIGQEILGSITTIPGVATGAKWHHERFDGNGYPDNLSGSDIPEIARIICVADAYDAMTSNRSYRRLMPQAKVREQIEQGRGTQFDPQIADCMIKIIQEDIGYNLHE